jgi:tetratricopeptide (TPR) repeat protein
MRAAFFLVLTFSLCDLFAQQKQRKPYQLFEEAEEQFADGHYAEASLLLDQCLRANPKYMEAYPLRAAAREQLNDLDGALTDYGIYLEAYPLHTDVLMSCAVLRYKIGFYDQARNDFLSLLRLGTSETTSVFYKQGMSVGDKNPIITTTNHGHDPYVFNYLGLIEYKLKNATQAIMYFDTAIRLENKEPDFYVNRGLARELLNDSTSVVEYEMALRLNPNHTLAQHNLEVYKQRKKQSMSVEDRLSRTIEADSTMLYPYLERAQQRFESGYFEGALEDYNQAAEMAPDNFEILFARGLTKEKLKNYDGAFSDYTRAIGIKEDYPKAWLSRGNVLLKLERYNDAIEDYNVALVYQPDYPLAFYNRGMANVKLKKSAEACSDFRKAEELGMKVDEKIKGKVCK